MFHILLCWFWLVNLQQAISYSMLEIKSVLFTWYMLCCCCSKAITYSRTNANWPVLGHSSKPGGIEKENWSEMSSCRLGVFNPLTTTAPHHIETSQLICSANQSTDFYMMGSTGRLWVNVNFELILYQMKHINQMLLIWAHNYLLDQNIYSHQKSFNPLMPSGSKRVTHIERCRFV